MGTLFQRIASVQDLERDAVVSPDGTLTYSQLLSRVAALAQSLPQHTGPIVLYGHKQPSMIVGIVAALALNRPYLPIDVSAPPSRVARMLDTAPPTIAVLAADPPAELASELSRRAIPTLRLDPLATSLASSHRSFAASSETVADPPEAIAYILFTSGTTGFPKGVPIPYQALTHFADWLLATQEIRSGREVFLNQAPFSFDLSVMDLYGSLLSGGTLFCLTRDEISDPRKLFARLDGSPLTVWVSTPSFARFCLAEPRFRQDMLPDLRRFLFCGETLPPAVARSLVQRFPRAEVWNTYGPTETTVAVTGMAIESSLAARDSPLPVGWPFPGVDVWVGNAAEPAQPLPPGESGEIMIAGTQVALGYRFGPVGSGDTLVDPFFVLADGRRAYRTGDLGRFDPSTGVLFWEGRIDRQIKLHGYRVELEEIEAHLREVPGIAEATVLVVNRSGQPDHLVAFAVPAVGSALPTDESDLTRMARTALAPHLPEYALPRIVRLIPTSPLTSNGKLDRRALSELL